MRRTQHMAMTAAHDYVANQGPEKCDRDELEALQAMISAVLWDHALEELTPDGKFRLEGEVF